MEMTVIALAAELCGADAEDALLNALCTAAVSAWEKRLDGSDATEDRETALRCAAAFTAAADYLGKQRMESASFTVGDVSVRSAAGQSGAALARELRETAERLMEPYAASGRFCFKGVRG